VNVQVRWVGPPGWRRLPYVTRGFLVAIVVAYVTGVFRLLPLGVLAADPARILSGEVWRLVTYPLVVVGIVNALFGLLLAWSFGSELETTWGSRTYGLFLLLAALLAGVLGTALALLVPGAGLLPGYGLSGLLTAVIVAWALLGPSLPANLFGVLPLTRKVFAILAVVLVAFGELETSRSPVQLAFALGGLPVAWLFARRGGGRPFTGSRRRRFTVVRGGWDDRVH